MTRILLIELFSVSIINLKIIFVRILTLVCKFLNIQLFSMNELG